MITEYRAESEDPIETLEDLSRIPDGRTEAPNVLGQVRQDVKLDLLDDLRWFNITEGIENISDDNF